MRCKPSEFIASIFRLCLLLPLILLLCSGCIGGIRDGVARAVLNDPDPETVRQGLPSYLLLLDGMIEDDPNDEDILLAASSLYGLSSSLATEDNLHRQRLAERAWRYGRQAICSIRSDFCNFWDLPLAEFTSVLNTSDINEAPALYQFGVGWLARLQTGDQAAEALADLPKVEALFARLVELDETLQNGGPQLYLGILQLLRPPSLGGVPDQGRAHLERAIELSGGRNLTAKVELAKRYARTLYDRELHDKLLQEVLAADPEAEGLTLFNVLAQEEARKLLASADEYF